MGTKTMSNVYTIFSKYIYKITLVRIFDLYIQQLNN